MQLVGLTTLGQPRLSEGAQPYPRQLVGQLTLGQPRLSEGAQPYPIQPQVRVQEISHPSSAIDFILPSLAPLPKTLLPPPL